MRFLESWTLTKALVFYHNTLTMVRIMSVSRAYKFSLLHPSANQDGTVPIQCLQAIEHERNGLAESCPSSPVLDKSGKRIYVQRKLAFRLYEPPVENSSEHEATVGTLGSIKYEMREARHSCRHERFSEPMYQWIAP